MKVTKAFIERGNDGNYSVYIEESSDLNYGIHGVGDTAKDAVNDFISAYDTMCEFHQTKGLNFIEATFEFQYDVASFLQYYSKKFTLAGLQEITGISQGLLSHYVNGRKKPRKETVEKIEHSIHQFANELSQVRFI